MDQSTALELLSPIAAEQGGLVTARQAVRVGVAHMTLVVLARRGLLRRLRRGVYAVAIGRASYPQEDTLAAWLAIDGGALPWQREQIPVGAVVSHASAASLLGLGTIIPSLPAITTQSQVSPHLGIQLHTAGFRSDDWTWWPIAETRLPVTTAARTIIDLLLAGEEIDYLERGIVEAFPDRSSAREALAAAASRRRKRAVKLCADVDALLEGIGWGRP
jgi:predicted transcriptional regulator of viral defense system